MLISNSKKKNFITAKSKKMFNRKTIRMTCNLLIIPYCDYGLANWLDHQAMIKSNLKLQNRVIRCVQKLIHGEHTRELFLRSSKLHFKDVEAFHINVQGLLPWNVEELAIIIQMEKDSPYSLRRLPMALPVTFPAKTYSRKFCWSNCRAKLYIEQLAQLSDWTP